MANVRGFVVRSDPYHGQTCSCLTSLPVPHHPTLIRESEEPSESQEAMTLGDAVQVHITW